MNTESIVSLRRYGISASDVLSAYLMASWYSLHYDFEIPYRIWLGGWSYDIYESTCFIFKE
jgi:hypothetical protein